MFIDGVTIFLVVSFSLFQYEVVVAFNDMSSVPDLVTAGSKSSNTKRRDAHNNNNNNNNGTYCNVKLEAWAVGITAGSREVPGRNACHRRHTYCIIIMTSCGIDCRYSISGTKLSDIFCEGQSASLTSFFNFLFLQIRQTVGKTFVVSTKSSEGLTCLLVSKLIFC